MHQSCEPYYAGPWAAVGSCVGVSGARALLLPQATRGPCTCRWRITVEVEVDKQRWRACDSDQQHALLGPGHGALVLCRKLSSSTRGAGMRNMVAGYVPANGWDRHSSCSYAEPSPAQVRRSCLHGNARTSARAASPPRHLLSDFSAPQVHRLTRSRSRS